MNPSTSNMTDWSAWLASAEQTLALGQALGGVVRAGDVLALIGELGAGKTCLVRGLAQGMGVDTDAVASPTFVMVHEYPPLPHASVTNGITSGAGGGLTLVHIDAYRLRELADLESIGWTEHESDGHDPLAELRRGAVVAVEWAQRVRGELGDDVLEIHLTHATDDHSRGPGRQVQLRALGHWRARRDELIQALDQAVAQGAGTQTPTQTPPTTPCPICNQPVAESSASFPFCSPRCKMVDLGKWLGGGYKISRPVEQRDLEEGVD